MKTALASTPVTWWRNGDSGTFFAGEWDIPDQMKIDNWSSYSLAFDGVDDYVDCSDPFNSTIQGTNFTISMWFNSSVNASYDCLLSNGTPC